MPSPRARPSASARRPARRLPLRRARATLAFERWGPVLLPVLLVAMALSCAALLGLHEVVPWWVHTGVLAAALAPAVWLTLRGARQAGAPASAAAPLARIEADSRLPAGALRAATDRPLTGAADDPYWQAHLERAARAARRARLRGPRAAADGADPWGLRYGLAVALVAALVLAGPAAPSRLASGLTPRLMPAGPVTADLWLDPPAYTGRAPVLLVRSAAPPGGVADTVSVPEGTTLRVRLSGEGKAPRARLRYVTQAGREDLVGERAEDAFLAESVLTAPGVLELRASGERTRFPIAVVPDEAPGARLTGPVGEEGGRRLTLPIETTDDYGIVRAEAVLRLAEDQPLPPDVPAPDPAVMASEAVVPLPAVTGPPGERLVAVDLTEHPWAGLNVRLSVRVADGAGQTDETPGVPVTLPTRSFYAPLARAVIEERRKLAIAPSSWPRTARLLDALTLAPERTAESTREYLLLRTAYHDVFGGRGADVPAVVDAFWPLAIELEDEGLALARARLDEAQAALRQALEDGAPQEEIERLIEALRQAMNDYVAALARSGDAEVAPGGPSMDAQDLDDMLDQMRELSERGAEAEARALLSQLEQMLQNMQLSQGGQGEDGDGQSGQGGEGEQAGGGASGGAGGGGEAGEGGPLDQAGGLIDRQRRLSDDTFSARRGERGTEGLAGEQRGVADALGALGEEAEGAGGAGREALGAAEDAMRAAASAIERGELGTAQALQERAIDQLREGAQALAEAEAEGRGERAGEGEEGRGRASNAGSPAGRDPLGRPYGPGGTDVQIPDMSDPERVREVLDQLRRRVADPDLPREEREYLERLLKRF